MGSIPTPRQWTIYRKSTGVPPSLPIMGRRATSFGRSGRVCMANSTNGAPVGQTEDRLAKLVAANEKLLARLTELEATVRQFMAEPSARRLMKAESTEQRLLGAEEAALTRIGKIEWPSPDDGVPFWKATRIKNNDISTADEKDISRSSREIGAHQDSDRVYVVHITAEMAPVAKVGGLGDVVTGLGRACLDRGHKVLVMLPFYECINKQEVEDLTEGESFDSYHKGSWTSVKTFRGNVTQVPVLLIEPCNEFFKGPSIYGGAYNELEAYLFFCRAALERMQVSGDHPDIIHIHEWHMGAVAMLYWDMYHHLSIKKPRIVLTIHNMEHYGECSLEQINMCGLDGTVYRTIDRAVDERTIGHNPERLTLLKGGIVYSNAVTTVSPTYATETLCSGLMANTLLKHRCKYSGILNGLDTVLWDPANDPCLPMAYHAQAIFGKQVCKQYIQKGLGLQPDEFSGDNNSPPKGKRSPLTICITRLVAQKGIHLIRHAIHTIGEQGGQFVLLGTAPDPRVQAEFEALARQLTDSKNIRLLLFYSEELAHMLYAAADIVLVPSMFEPCGLTQMIGMRYGAIPVVRRTGGLADTVFDVDDSANANKSNGFVFDGISEEAFSGAMNRALSYYNQRREWWQEMSSRAMEIDFSWDKSAQEYLAVYNSVRI